MSDYTPHEIGWDDEISVDSSYTLLEDGDYNFTVTGFERSRFPGSQKIPACSKAILTLSAETGEGTVDVKYDLILWSTLEWKLSEFLRAIGQKKHGEPTRPRWNEMIGARGRARSKQRTYTKKDGSEGRANDVEKFYDYDPSFFQQSPNTAPPPAPAYQQTGFREMPGDRSPNPWTPGKF